MKTFLTILIVLAVAGYNIWVFFENKDIDKYNKAIRDYENSIYDKSFLAFDELCKQKSDAAKKAAMRGGEGNRGTNDHYKDIAGSGKVTHDKYNAYNAKKDNYTKIRNNREGSKSKCESASVFDALFDQV